MPTYQSSNTVTFSIYIYDNDGNTITATVSAAPSWVTGYDFTQSILPDGRTEGILSVYGDLSGVAPGTYSITVRSTDGVTPETVRTYPIYVQTINAYSSPSDVPNCKVWMSADGSTPQLETGDYVDEIPNLVPAYAGFKATQVNDFRKPIFVENIVNGYPAWYFGSGSVMRINYPGTADYSQNTERTIIMVAKLDRLPDTTSGVFVQSGSVWVYNPSYSNITTNSSNPIPNDSVNYGNIPGRFLWMFSMWDPQPVTETHNLDDTDIPYFRMLSGYGGSTIPRSYSIMVPRIEVKENMVESWIYLNSSYKNPRVSNTLTSSAGGYSTVPQALDTFVPLNNWNIITVVLENEQGSYVNSLYNNDSLHDVRFAASHSKYPLDRVYINGIRYVEGKSGNRVESDMFIGWNLHGYITELCVFDRKLTNAERQNVENYLAKKYNIPYFVDPAETIESWVPKVVLRFDANSLTASYNTGDKVDSWVPVYVSTSAYLSYSLTQSNPDNQPVFVRDAYNGLSAVVFRGNEWLRSMGLEGTGLEIEQPFAIGIVGSFANGGLFSGGTLSVNPHIFCEMPHNWGIGGSSTEYTLSLATRDQVVVGVFSGNSSLRISGIPLMNNVAVGPDGINILTIGTDGVRPLVGSIYELVIIKSPTERDIILLEQYLAARSFTLMNRADVHADHFVIIK